MLTNAFMMSEPQNKFFELLTKNLNEEIYSFVDNNYWKKVENEGNIYITDKAIADKMGKEVRLFLTGI